MLFSGKRPNTFFQLGLTASSSALAWLKSPLSMADSTMDCIFRKTCKSTSLSRLAYMVSAMTSYCPSAIRPNPPHFGQGPDSMPSKRMCWTSVITTIEGKIVPHAGLLQIAGRCAMRTFLFLATCCADASGNTATTFAEGFCKMLKIKAKLVGTTGFEHTPPVSTPNRINGLATPDFVRVAWSCLGSLASGNTRPTRGDL